MWYYTRRDGKQRGLTVQPSEILDAKRSGAKWHPDMRDRFGAQCSHGSMMQIRESLEWKLAVEDYATARGLDLQYLLSSMCKHPQQPRNPTPRMPRLPDDGSPKPGDLVIDDGGRTAWRKSSNYQVMKGRVGDCSTRAMQVTLRDTIHAVSYNTICFDVIGDKKRNYPSRSKTWKNNNYAVYNDTTRRLMEQYTRTDWTYVNVWVQAKKHPAFKTVAARLAGLKSVMLVSRNHIAAVRSGVIHDTWDSKYCRTTQVLCRQEDASEVKRLLSAAK